ncbi:MAG: lysylphosphatidylglycerol synthase transmembrane domain-containing protein [Candidatus Cryptobacteroides sp.]
MDKKQIFKYIFSAVIAAILLWFSFRGVSWSDFAEGLKTCRWGYILISMALGVLTFWLRAVRWRRLLLPIDGSITRKTAFNAVNIGYLANFVFPRIGEFARCGVISSNSQNLPDQDDDIHRKKASYDKVLGTVVLERGWDMLSMIILLVVLLAARWGKFGGFFIDEIWKPASGRLTISLWWIVVALAVVAAIAVWAIWKYRNVNKLCSKIWGIARGLVQGFASCLKMEHKWVFFLYTVLIWASYWFMAAATMRAVPDLDALNLVDALFLSLAGSIGWVVPVPGGIGAFHFVVSLALSSIYGLPFAQGIVFATLSHESQSVTMILFGGLSYISETFRRRKSN